MIGRIALYFVATLLFCMDISQAQSREILFSASPSDELKTLAEKIRNLDTPQIPYEAITKNATYYVRIAPRKNILTDANQLQDNAILGTRPFVFITTPEGIDSRIH